MSTFISVDPGTGYMKQAGIDISGRAVSGEYPDGEYQMPSCVFFDQRKFPVFGTEASNRGLIEPNNLVAHWKREIGSTEVLYTDSDGAEYRSTDILALLLKECRRVAEMSIGTVVSRVVLTTPANVDDGAKQDILAAAKAASLEVIKLVHEPTAAIFFKTAGTDRKIPDGYRTVVDVGCGTTDVSIENKSGNTHSIVATNGVGKLGGLDFTRELLEHCAAEFEKANGIRISQKHLPEDYADLWNRCETAKKTLNQSDKVSIPMIIESKRLQTMVTRDEYKRITQHLTDQIIACVDKTIGEAGIGRDDLLELIPIGGGAISFCVVESLEAYLGKPISNQSDPLNAVAKGAALIGWEEEGSVVTPEGVRLPSPQNIMRDVTGHGIGVLALDHNDEERFTTILTKGVPMPSEYTKLFSLSEEGATAASIKILQGQTGDDPGQCSVLGEFQLTELQPVYGQPHKIEICLNIDGNGMLTATARDSSGGKTADLEMAYEKATAI